MVTTFQKCPFSGLKNPKNVMLSETSVYNTKCCPSEAALATHCRVWEISTENGFLE